MKFLGVLFLGIFAALSFGQQKREPSAAVPDRHEVSFGGRIIGGQEYSRELGEGLSFRFSPLKDNWGWIIQVGPLKSKDDYAYPVNPPYRSDNSQWLGTGYGDTVEQQLKHEHRVFFALNQLSYEQAMKFVDDFLESRDPEAARKLSALLPSVHTGLISVRPIRYETANEGNSVNWMEYSVKVTTPASFHPAPSFSVSETACPPNHTFR